MVGSRGVTPSKGSVKMVFALHLLCVSSTETEPSDPPFFVFEIKKIKNYL